MKYLMGAVIVVVLLTGAVWFFLSNSTRNNPSNNFLVENNMGAISSKAPVVGSVAPNFIISTVDGKEIELAALRGKPVIIESYAYWCPSCLIEGKNLSQAVTPYKDKVELVAFTFDPSEKKEGAEDFKKRVGAFWDFVLLDQGKETLLTYQLTSPDVTYIIDKDGEIVFKDKGVTEPETFKAEIEKVI